MLRSVSVSSVQRPMRRPISRAVAVVSPVTILTSMPALRHSVTAAGYAEHCEAAAYAFGGYSLLAVGQRAECECERTHGLILILGQRGAYAFALLLRHVAHRKQYLGRTLHIEDSPAGLGR